MVCKRCGAHIETGQERCAFCGTAVTGDDTEKVRGISTIRTPIVLLAAAAVLLVLIGMRLYLLLEKRTWNAADYPQAIVWGLGTATGLFALLAILSNARIFAYAAAGFGSIYMVGRFVQGWAQIQVWPDDIVRGNWTAVIGTAEVLLSGIVAVMLAACCFAAARRRFDAASKRANISLLLQIAAVLLVIADALFIRRSPSVNAVDYILYCVTDTPLVVLIVAAFWARWLTKRQLYHR